MNENIIVESNVLDWLECGELCLDTRFCVGYNFKKSSTDGQVNCQLTDTGDHIFERISTEDNDWTFYRTEGKQIVSVFSNLEQNYTASPRPGYMQIYVAIIFNNCFSLNAKKRMNVKHILENFVKNVSNSVL